MAWRLLIALLCATAGARADTAEALAREVNAGVAALSTHPSLAAWRATHQGERFAAAVLGQSSPDYETDFLLDGAWCGVWVSHLHAGLSRAAQFYVPTVRQGALPPLPDAPSPGLTDSCSMEAFWYQTPPQPTALLVQALSKVWGPPNGAPVKPNVRGSAFWRSVAAWHRAGVSVWVALDPLEPGVSLAVKRLVVYARTDTAHETTFALSLIPDHIARRALEAAWRLVAPQPSPFSATILRDAQCQHQWPKEPETAALARARRWMRWTGDLDPPRRAAALLVADSFVACNAVNGPLWEPLGARYETRCPQDGPVYSHNLRRRALALDPQGKAGELGGILYLADPCLVPGRGMWQDRLARLEENLLETHNADEWTPWVWLALARTHSSKLAISYPSGDPEENGLKLTAGQQQSERDQAVGYLRRFLQQNPNGDEALDAWQEAWRLLAGLPPSPVRFGCGCE